MATRPSLGVAGERGTMELLDELRNKPYAPDLPFPVSEYRRRVANAQTAMAAQGLDIHLISITPNLGYLTGYDTSMPSGYAVGLLPAKGEVGLHCSELEGCCALQSSTIDDIELYRWYDAQDTASQLGLVLRERGLDRARIGVEMGNPETFASGAFDTRSFLKLKEMLPRAEFVDSTNLIMELRLFKVPQEIEYMRKAAEISLKGLFAAIETAGEGVNENECVGAAQQAMLSAGSELMSIDPMLMSGERTGWMPHVPYKRNVLQRRDSMYLEFTGTYNRYNAPTMRSAAIGEATNDVRRVADTSIRTVSTILDNAKPGRSGHDVAIEAGKVLAEQPDIYFHGAFGYSIGMGHQPTWTEAPMYLAEGNERELSPGMCFHTPICVFVPRGVGVGFSESIVITESGCEVLGPGTRRELVIR